MDKVILHIKTVSLTILIVSALIFIRYFAKYLFNTFGAEALLTGFWTIWIYNQAMLNCVLQESDVYEFSVYCEQEANKYLPTLKEPLP